VHHVPLTRTSPRIVDRSGIVGDFSVGIGVGLGVGEVEGGIDNVVDGYLVDGYLVDGYLVNG